MNCNICQEEIKDPFHIEINAIVIKHDVSYVAGLIYTSQEKRDMSEKLIAHKSCWQKILISKTDKTKKLEVI